MKTRVIQIFDSISINYVVQKLRRGEADQWEGVSGFSDLTEAEFFAKKLARDPGTVTVIKEFQ